jgi:hypothetical protein
MKSKHSGAQIIGAVKQVEARRKPAEVARAESMAGGSATARWTNWMPLRPLNRDC